MKLRTWRVNIYWSLDVSHDVIEMCDLDDFQTRNKNILECPERVAKVGSSEMWSEREMEWRTAASFRKTCPGWIQNLA